MPLDLNLMYGEMFASAILHGCLPFLVYIMVKDLVSMTRTSFIVVLVVACSIASFLLNMGLLTMIQANTCGGVNNFKTIAIGSFLGSLITAIMVLIPTYIEPMRLMISTFFLAHNIILDQKDALNQQVLLTTAQTVTGMPSQTQKTQPTLNDIENQTRHEIAIGASYWLAAAGAYGVGIGTLWSGTSC